MKTKTIDEISGGPGSFKKFINKKETFLKKIEEKRKERIKCVRATRKMSWATI